MKFRKVKEKPNHHSNQEETGKIKWYMGKYNLMKTLEGMSDDYVNRRIEVMAEDMLKWSLEDDATDFYVFLNCYTIPQSTFDKWLSRSSYLVDTYRIVKQRIGQRLNEKLENNKGNTTSLLRRIAYYHRDYRRYVRDSHKRKLDLLDYKSKADARALKDIAFVTPEIPTTEIVDESLKRAKNNKPE